MLNRDSESAFSLAMQLLIIAVAPLIATVASPNRRYGDLYTENNVAVSATHTHSGPGGYLQYFVYIITSYGFVRQSFDVIVDGIEKSIVQAHENLRPGSIYVNEE